MGGEGAEPDKNEMLLDKLSVLITVLLISFLDVLPPAMLKQKVYRNSRCGKQKLPTAPGGDDLLGVNE